MNDWVARRKSRKAAEYLWLVYGGTLRTVDCFKLIDESLKAYASSTLNISGMILMVYFDGDPMVVTDIRVSVLLDNLKCPGYSYKRGYNV